MCMPPCTWLTCEIAELMGLCTAGTQKVEVLWQVKSSLSLEAKRTLSPCQNKTKFQILPPYTYLFISLFHEHSHLSHSFTTVHTPTNTQKVSLFSVSLSLIYASSLYISLYHAALSAIQTQTLKIKLSVSHAHKIVNTPRILYSLFCNYKSNRNLFWTKNILNRGLKWQNWFKI